VRYLRVYTGDDGRARFEDLAFALASKEFAPPAPPVNVSKPVEASAFMVLRSPAGWTDGAHPAPARQFMIVLEGSLEVSASGETRVLSVGDRILLEDTTGPGHGSTVLEDLAMAVVRL
jgi:quercetin dioxygenase-like cupin family protein